MVRIFVDWMGNGLYDLSTENAVQRLANIFESPTVDLRPLAGDLQDSFPGTAGASRVGPGVTGPPGPSKSDTEVLPTQISSVPKQMTLDKLMKPEVWKPERGKDFLLILAFELGFGIYFEAYLDGSGKRHPDVQVIVKYYIHMFVCNGLLFQFHRFMLYWRSHLEREFAGGVDKRREAELMISALLEMNPCPLDIIDKIKRNFQL